MAAQARSSSSSSSPEGMRFMSSRWTTDLPVAARILPALLPLAGVGLCGRQVTGEWPVSEVMEEWPVWVADLTLMATSSGMLPAGVTSLEFTELIVLGAATTVAST